MGDGAIGHDTAPGLAARHYVAVGRYGAWLVHASRIQWVVSAGVADDAATWLVPHIDCAELGDDVADAAFLVIAQPRDRGLAVQSRTGGALTDGIDVRLARRVRNGLPNRQRLRDGADIERTCHCASKSGPTIAVGVRLGFLGPGPLTTGAIAASGQTPDFRRQGEFAPC